MKPVNRSGNSRTWFRPLALLLIVAMLLGPWSAALAATEAPPTIMAENKTVLTGDTFEVMISIKDASDLSAFQFSLDYDPQIVSVLDVTLGSFLTSTGRVLGGEVGPTINASTGVVTYGAFTNGPTPAGPAGSGVLARVTMQALAGGFSALNLFGLTTSNTAGVAQAPVGQGGSVAVAVAPAPATAMAAPNLMVGLGGNFNVAITISGAADLSAYQFTLTYDPTVVEFVSATNSSYLTSTGRTFGGLVGPMSSAGSVSFGAFTTGDTPAGPSGAGPNTLAVLTFYAKKVGASNLDLSGTLVSDSAGVTRLASATDGSVQVKQPQMRVDCDCTTPYLVGTDFEVDVKIDYAADMSAFQFTLNWDPTVLQLVKVDLGSFLLSTGRTFGGIVRSDGAGTLTYGAYTVDDNPPGPSGSGVLATLKFKPLKVGQTVLNLVDSSVSNTRGDNFGTLRVDGCVRVENPPTAVELSGFGADGAGASMPLNAALVLLLAGAALLGGTKALARRRTL